MFRDPLLSHVYTCAFIRLMWVWIRHQSQDEQQKEAEEWIFLFHVGYARRTQKTRSQCSHGSNVCSSGSAVEGKCAILDKFIKLLLEMVTLVLP